MIRAVVNGGGTSQIPFLWNPYTRLAATQRSRPSYGAQMCWIQGARPATWSKGAALAAPRLTLPAQSVCTICRKCSCRPKWIRSYLRCRMRRASTNGPVRRLTDKRRAPQQQQDRKTIAGIRSRKQCGSGSQDSQEEDATRGYLSGDEAPQGL